MPINNIVTLPPPSGKQEIFSIRPPTSGQQELFSTQHPKMVSPRACQQTVMQAIQNIVPNQSGPVFNNCTFNFGTLK